jgi:K+-transporting ATPase ATPase C chain
MSTRLPNWLRQHVAALRILIVFTALFGVVYPLAVTGIAQLPGLHDHAQGSFVTSADGRTVGSALIGQSFTDADGNALPGFFQSRPSAAGEQGYDPTATSPSNLGPEDVVDSPDDPATPDDESRTSLLTEVCTRSLAVGELEGVDGSRKYCTGSGVGAVLAVFYSQPNYTGEVTDVVSVNEFCPAVPFLDTYAGVKVSCRELGTDVAAGRRELIRGDAPEDPVVPADAVTASASGLDPHISPEYAVLQVTRVARERGMTPDEVRALVDDHSTGRALGFIGEPTVNVVELNLALERAGTSTS